MEAWQIPPAIAQLCSRLLEALGLVFGCFDFIVTPDEEYVFLEVNPSGQFLFVERHTGMPLLDAFCEFLIHARADFEYGGNPAVHLADVNAIVEQRLSELPGLHVVLPDEELQEGTGPP